MTRKARDKYTKHAKECLACRQVDADKKDRERCAEGKRLVRLSVNEQARETGAPLPYPNLNPEGDLYQ